MSASAVADRRTSWYTGARHIKLSCLVTFALNGGVTVKVSELLLAGKHRETEQPE